MNVADDDYIIYGQPFTAALLRRHMVPAAAFYFNILFYYVLPRKRHAR